MRHFKKRVLALLLAGAVGIGNYASVSASAIKDAQDKKDEAQQEPVSYTHLTLPTKLEV